MDETRTRIALLLGDPTGIGPEIVVKAVCGPGAAIDARVIVIGDSRAFSLAQTYAKTPSSVPTFDRWDEAERTSSDVIFFEWPGASPDEYTPGEVSAAAGRATLESMAFAAELAARAVVDAIVYAPLNKHALSLGGSPFKDELPERVGRRLRRGRLYVSRPGSGRDEAPRLRPRRHGTRRASGSCRYAGARNRVRHRREGNRESAGAAQRTVARGEDGGRVNHEMLLAPGHGSMRRSSSRSSRGREPQGCR